MSGFKWARLQADIKCALRRGAWYRLMKLAGFEAVLDVNRQPHSVPSYLLEIANTPPRRWTVVPREAGAAGRAAGIVGPQYAVCPACRERSALPKRGRPRTLDCARCRGTFEVDWSEGYLS